MNFPQNLSDMDYKINQKMASSKNSTNQDILKGVPSNPMTINFSKDENNSNSVDLNNNKINNLKQKAYISAYDNENEKENEEEEEEEINSDEYVSSTNLDVDTNTYINLTNNTVVTNKEDKNNNKINSKNKNSMLTQGKLKIKENDNNLNDILLNNIQTIENEKEIEIKKNTNDNIAIKTNKTNYKKTNSNNSNDNNNEVKKVHHHNNKSDYFVNNRPSSISKDKKNNSNNSNSKDKKGIFTPSNDSKKKFKILRDMIFKKLDQYQNKNIYSVGQSNTINIIENIEDNKNDIENDNDNDNNMISINNDIVKVDMGVDKSKRNKTSRITNNNSISIISNNSNKNISVKAGQYQNMRENNNKKKNKINIYNKNIIKEIDTINIDDQKYEMIPQSIKKIKTQGRIGKIVYSNQNKKNNFVYISNNSNNININSNRNFNSPLIKKNNRISPQNCINNVEYFNSICTHKNKKVEENIYLKHSNIHSLKNLKSESLQKNIKKYLLEDEYLSVFPLNNDKQKMKILKDSKNKKSIKYQNQNIKYNEDKYKKINNNNIANKKQIKSGNSAYSKNFMNNYQSEHILNTISNHNKKVDFYSNFKNNNNLVQNKNSNISKKISNEKNNKNRELSFNLAQENNSSIKDLLSLKKIKNLKNKYILQSPDVNLENGGRNTNNYQTKKNNPLTTRIKLDIMAEENKNNIRKNHTKYVVNISNNNANKKNKNNSNSRKRIIYIENNHLKNMNTKSLLYNSLSPNCQSIKQLVDKSKINNIKEMYDNINYNNQGRNTYNIYSSSKNNYNTNNISNINNNINININSNSNKAFYKKIQRENVRDKRSIGESTINYNDNMSEYQKSNLSANNKKIIIFNNVSNYNINHTENILNNIDSIRNDPNNGYKKTIEILSPFARINNKNNAHKKFYVNKQNTNSQKIINSKIYSRDSKDKKNNMTLIEQKNIYLDNSKNKNNHNHNYHHIYNGNISSNNSNSNKYLYNKNVNQKLNKNENMNINYGHNRVNSSQYNGITKINNNNISNNFIQGSISNDKERNTITNKSYGNLNLSKRAKDKNITNEIFEKIQKNYTKKSMSPIQK